MTLPDILAELGIDYRLGGSHQHVREGWVGVDCPWCGMGTNKFHLGLIGQSAVCWQCGTHRLGDAIQEITSKPLGEILYLLGSLESAPTRPLTADQPRGRVSIPSGLRALGERQRAYLKGRGFDPDELERIWGLQGIGLAGPLAWRIWIPVHYNGEVVSWTTRSIGITGLRYLSAKPDQEARPLKSLLYGEDLASHSVVVCEGPADVWRLGPGAVCVFGLNYSAKQIERLSRFRSRAICFDREPAAQRQARRLALNLASHPGETHVVELETGTDLADADKDEIKAVREKFVGV